MPGGASRRLFVSATARLIALIFILQIVMTGGVLLLARNAIIQQSERDRQALVTELSTIFAPGGTGAATRRWPARSTAD